MKKGLDRVSIVRDVRLRGQFSPYSRVGKAAVSRRTPRKCARFFGDFGITLNECDADIFQMTRICSSKTWPSLIENARSGFSAFGRGEMMKYATSG
jgi:hypothetical protein